MKNIASTMENFRSISYFRRREEAKPPEERNTVLIKLLEADLDYKMKEPNEKKEEKTAVTKIKICIASSISLQEERSAIENYLSWKNDKLIEQGVYLQYNVWEKQSPRFNHTYKQEDYNETLVFDSEIFVCLIGDNVGKFTQEEFDKAKERFDKGEMPFVFCVYFKNFTDKDSSFYESEGWQKRIALKKHIETDFEQFYGSFENKDALIRNIDNHIEEDIEIVKKKNSGKLNSKTY